MDSTISTQTDGKGFNLLISVAAFVVIVAGMQAAQPILVPVLMAVFISIISSPAIFWLENRKCPRVLAFMIVVCFVILILSLVGMLISSSVADFMHNLPKYQKQLRGITDSGINFADRHKIPISSAQVMQNINPSVALGFAGNMIGGIGGVLSNALLIFLTVAFMLFESSTFPRKLKAISLDSDDAHQPVGIFTRNIKKYLMIKTITSFSTGVIVAVFLALFDVDYALLWGMLAFFLNFIPSIGAIIAGIPPVLLALVQHNWQTSLWVMVIYIAVNCVIGNFIEPKFMGKGLGLSPLVVFLSLIFWGWVLGPVGMFLSVPLTMTAKIACDSKESTKWIGVFLGP